MKFSAYATVGDLDLVFVRRSMVDHLSLVHIIEHLYFLLYLQLATLANPLFVSHLIKFRKCLNSNN